LASASFNLFPWNGGNLPYLTAICGSFQTNGASPVVLTGKGYTVTQVGTGLYRVAFNKYQPHIVSGSAELVKGSASDTDVELVDQADANQYVTWRVKNNTGAAVAPGNVADAITFIIITMAKKLPVK
jgi:hypothetical protein